MFDTSSWFYQCTCLAAGDEDTQLPEAASIAVVDENGEIVDVDKPLVKTAAGLGPADFQSVPPETDAKEAAPVASEPAGAVAAAADTKVAPAPVETFLETEPGVDIKQVGKKPADGVPTTELPPKPAKPAEVADKVPSKPLPKDKPRDIVVELAQFKQDLKAGIPIKKHCRDGRIRKRTLLLDASGKKIGWKKNQNPDTMIDLAEVLEVRNATELDPNTVGDAERPKGMAGTETLRKTCDGLAVAKRAFSLILRGRTLDIELPTELEAKKLSAAFKVLVQKIKDEKGASR
ncbi:hypothetical protein CTAYLR_004466 [Chrysophaeum taylorii]|uniref:Uncharacterized protein n=1 Tax=Chrysophaeum taylorii TaxID=2483200 RepID=A0AAD7UBN5_9STRA|nr:hypothetical protein CTAYLR_004466 [Chrysophaeum taylorii]